MDLRAWTFALLLAGSPVAAWAGDWTVVRLRVAGAHADTAPVAVREPGGGSPKTRPLRVNDALPDGSTLSAEVDVEIELLSPGRMRALKEAGDSGTLLLVFSGVGGDRVEVSQGKWSFKRLAGAMGRALDPFTASAGSGTASTRGTEFSVAVDEQAAVARFAVQQGSIQVVQQGRVRIGDGAAGQGEARWSARRLLAAGDPALSVPLNPAGWLWQFTSFDNATAAFEQQVRDADARGYEPAITDALIALGDLLLLAGRPADALPPFDRALAMVQGPDDAYWKAVLLGRRGSALQALNRFNDAALALRDSLKVHEGLPHREGEWTVEEQSTNIALNLLLDGTLRCADRWAERLLQRLDTVGAGPARHIRAPLWGIRGSAASGLADFRSAHDRHTRALEMQTLVDHAKRDRTGQVASIEVAQAMIALGYDEQALGSLAAAEALHRRALAITDGLFTAPHPVKADARLGLAELQRAGRRGEEALGQVSQALALLDAVPPDTVRRGDAWLLRAELLREGGRPAQAVEAYREARRLLSEVWPDASNPRFATLLPGLAGALRASGAPEAQAKEAEDSARAGALALLRREQACPP